ncbi:MAG: PD-(D/E)XK nuclease family protein [Candidatus Beckwithbacteria bacterium]|nr:PD-(D/E)XK nuclease family protein [Candidatus Beckwithbacteria bacterium]
MDKDKFSAVWVSHSSISDWLACPRAYYLKNVYKDPKTGRKTTLINPAMALGQAVHEVVEGLSVLSVERRFSQSLLEKLEVVWKKISGKRGGFLNEKIEGEYKQRGREMLKRVETNPGVLKNLAVKIKMELPYYWLSEKDNIILCGKIDWLEYLKETDSVHIIDFKTGKDNEKADSLQLPIYYLLATNTQKRPVTKMSYWYIDRENEPVERKLPDIDKAREKILKIAKEMKLARQLNRFKCPTNGCRECKPMEAIINGEGEFVGKDEIGRSVYILTKCENQIGKSEIL